jgi:hypothetical protein
MAKLGLNNRRELIQYARQRRSATINTQKGSDREAPVFLKKTPNTCFFYF